LSLRRETLRWSRLVAFRTSLNRLRLTFGIAAFHLGLLGAFVVLTPVTAMAQCVAPSEMREQLATHPTAENYAALGTWFADHNRFSCAASEFAAALKRKPESASYAYLLGLSSHSAGDESGALTALTKATQLDINDIRPHLLLGAVYDKQERTGDAEAEYRAALAIDPGSAAALDALSQNFIARKDYASIIVLLDKPGGSNGARTSLESLNLGIAYAADARLDDATRVLREGLDDSPDSLPIADELAVVLMLHGRDKEAYALLDSVLARHPEDETTQMLYLHILVTGHGEKAPALADKLLESYPYNWEAKYLKGVLEMRDGDFKSARGFLERSIALNPKYDHSRADLGSVLASLGDLSGAKTNLMRAIELGDGEPEVHYNLARVLMRLDDSAQAQEQLKIYQKLKGAESGKAQAAGKAEEGDQAMIESDPAEAADFYREAIESDREEAVLFYKLSRALDKMSDLTGEKTALQRAIALNPGLAEAQNQMGFLAVHAGNLAVGESYFRAAVEASPSYAVAWINLAATLMSEQRWADARQAMDHALEIDPENRQARKLSQDLSEAHPTP
jgi:Flp pilus assembly protein TadD